MRPGPPPLVENFNAVIVRIVVLVRRRPVAHVLVAPSSNIHHRVRLQLRELRVHVPVFVVPVASADAPDLDLLVATRAAL